MTAPSDAITVGVDLGGTKVLTALVDATGTIVASYRRATDPKQGAAAVIADIVAGIEGCLSQISESGAALGIGVAGQVDVASGAVRFALNLGWRDIPIRAELEDALGIPVVVANDVRAAAWGECLHGAGIGSDNAVTIFVGTGVGGAVVDGGRLLEGCGNGAGELGHVTVVVDGRRCRCPNWGCLEAYIGGWAIAERAQEAVEADAEAGRALVDLAGSVEAITARDVTQAYGTGDSLARRIVEDTGHYLISGAVGMVNAFNPCILILGGGVIEGLPELVDEVAKGIQDRALPTPREEVKVVKAVLGGDAGVVGAAAMARQVLGERV